MHMILMSVALIGLSVSCASLPRTPPAPAAGARVLVVPVYGHGQHLTHAVGTLTPDCCPPVFCPNNRAGLLLCALTCETGDASLQVDAEGYYGEAIRFLLPLSDATAPGVGLVPMRGLPRLLNARIM